MEDQRSGMMGRKRSASGRKRTTITLDSDVEAYINMRWLTSDGKVGATRICNEAVRACFLGSKGLTEDETNEILERAKEAVKEIMRSVFATK